MYCYYYLFIIFSYYYWFFFFFFSSRGRHTRCALVTGVSDVCSSDLLAQAPLLDDAGVVLAHHRYRLIGPPLPHGLMLGTAFHRRRARPHMHGRLLLDSAPLVAAMVHPLRDVRPFQRRI